MARCVLPLLSLVCAPACRQPDQGTGAVRDPVPDSVAQVAYGVRSNLLTNRVLRAELVADTALFAESGRWVQLGGVRVAFFAVSGDSVGRLTARQGGYDLVKRQLLLSGTVTVVTRDGRQLTASRMTYDVVRGRLVGDTAFSYTGPDRRLTGPAFEAGPALRDVRDASAARARRER